ncbi:uncharacterized protein ASCRUDRAFT_73547 [Ascoidea rubescens DSM 1968]|uniref:Uncharacterized protein n=1 Tax=Ascoidea rubescens DSM 1968 TaxID=1344418 RepID=A0A1D2VQ88_9ASCO|nr:hypothetical protein ASCRUDRAFT_73547 [Ascoidea rubescens DSM 1968]ODV63759.1 hypothetical protein ASCRUDRAFT_73547 [Ascoidea rubescens DSM 1968]
MRFSKVIYTDVSKLHARAPNKSKPSLLKPTFLQGHSSKLFKTIIDSDNIEMKTVQSILSQKRVITDSPGLADFELPLQFSENYKSNVLAFKSDNPLLHISDFQNLFLSSHIDRGLMQNSTPKLSIFKGRNKFNYSFNNFYFLIFLSHKEAGVFVLETLDRMLNGRNFSENVSFYNVKYELKNIIFPIFSDSEQEYKSLINEYANDPKVLAFDLTDKRLTDNLNKRQRSLLITGFPYYMDKEFLLENNLWEYDVSPNFNKSVKKLSNGNWVVTFTNTEDPIRFIRKYNGFYYENDPTFKRVFAEVLD